jgi:hypothetical protein
MNQPYTGLEECSPKPILTDDRSEAPSINPQCHGLVEPHSNVKITNTSKNTAKCCVDKVCDVMFSDYMLRK